MSSLDLDQLSKLYPGGVRAVDDVSLGVAEGELLVLFGPSGCGKTTLLRMIAGLERPSGGRILFDGRRVDHLRPRERDVALVTQHPSLYPHLSVAGNLAFGLRLRRCDRREIACRVQQAAATLHIQPLLERRPGELSGGERQRVALGRALVRRPRLLLIDEPLTNLDAPLRRQLRQEIRRLHDESGVTTLYVTHDQSEALTLGDRIAVLRGGRVQQIGPPREIYQHPANRFVAAAVGQPGMNFFEGRVVAHGPAANFDAGDFTLPLAGSPAAGPATLGLRPEAFSIAPGDAPPTAGPGRVCARVLGVEWLGADVCLHLAGGRHEFLVRLPAARTAFQPGDSVPLCIQPDQASLFDAATGATL